MVIVTMIPLTFIFVLIGTSIGGWVGAFIGDMLGIAILVQLISRRTRMRTNHKKQLQTFENKEMECKCKACGSRCIKKQMIDLKN